MVLVMMVRRKDEALFYLCGKKKAFHYRLAIYSPMTSISIIPYKFSPYV